MNFKEYREIYGVSQGELAKKLGISQVMVSKIERNLADISPEVNFKFKNLITDDYNRIEIDVKIDYLKVSFKGIQNSFQFIAEYILNIDSDAFILEERGNNGYDIKYIFDQITIYTCVSDERLINQGSLLEFKGAGCRLLEKILKMQGRSLNDFLFLCLINCHKITRIDLAIDDYIGYLKMSTLLKKYEKNLFDCVFRVDKPYYENKTTSDLRERQGISLVFGSRKSKQQIILYEKGKELAKKLDKNISEIDVVNRFELRFHDERADQIINYLVNGMPIETLAMGLLKERLTFYEDDGQTVYCLWSKFFENVETMKLLKIASNNQYEEVLRRKINFIKLLALKSVMILEKIDEINGTSLIKNLRDEIQFNKKDEKLIEWSTTNYKDYFVKSQ